MTGEYVVEPESDAEADRVMTETAAEFNPLAPETAAVVNAPATVLD